METSLVEERWPPGRVVPRQILAGVFCLLGVAGSSTSSSAGRLAGLGGPEAVPLNGAWAMLANPAALGIGPGSWEFLVDVDLADLDVQRYILVQSDPTSRGPAGASLARGEDVDLYELALVLPDSRTVAYGLDLKYFDYDDLDGIWGVDFNLAARTGGGLQLGLVVADFISAETNGPHTAVAVGGKFVDGNGSILTLDLGDVDLWRAERVALGVEVPEGSLAWRGGISWEPEGRRWALGVGTTSVVSFLADYALVRTDGAFAHRIAIGMRLK